jgi:nucleotide-binding universal stress UspA family protein
MRWIVGVDVGAGPHGALVFAAWAARTGAPRGGDLVAVHVLEDEHLRVVLRLHHLDEVSAAARQATEETLARHELEVPVEIVQAVEASDGLAAAAERLTADAIVVGRHAGVDGSGLARLGRIARRTLRELAAPVIVVPHDLTPEAIGPGPVLALSSLGDDSVEAVRFARRLASWAGRELVVAHAVRFAVDRGATYLGSSREGLDGQREQRLSEGRSALERWTAANEVRADRIQVVEGSVLASAPRLAREFRAPLLVTGSRMLSGIDRQLHTSVGSELAASAPLAVAVVPPAPGRDRR